MMGTETESKNEITTTEECLRNRPLWQRIIYPAVGVIFIVLGIIGWLVPIIPGFPLIIIGLPLLVCINPRFELWARRLMRKIGQAMKKRFWKKGSGQVRK